MKYLVYLVFFVSYIAVIISCPTPRDNSDDKGTLCTLGVIYIMYLLFSGTCCKVLPRDCKDHYEQGHTCSGIYTIKPDRLPAFKVLQL